MKTTVLAQNPDGTSTVLGIVDQFTMSESRNYERIYVHGELVELRPIPGSHVKTVTLNGFVPRDAT